MSNPLEMSLDTISALGEHFGLNAEDIAPLYGVPIRHFCLRWLLSSAVFPCGKNYLLAGEAGVGKTSMTLEFSRLIVDECKTMILGIHTEEKWPDTLPKSILREYLPRLKFQEADTAQKWMSILTKVFKEQLMKENLKRFPVVLFVDSLVGAQGQDRKRKIIYEGAPRRDFSEVALAISAWMPVFGDLLQSSSALMFFILHLKETTEAWYTSGGKTKDFFSSYTLYLTRASQKVVTFTSEGYYDVKIRIHKDSYGPGQKDLIVRCSWEFDENQEQLTRYQWDEATTEMLNTWSNGSDKVVAPKKSGYYDVIPDLTSKSGGSKGTLYQCKTITGKEYLTAREFGHALEENDKVRKDLDAVFHITPRKTWREHFDEIDRIAVEEEEAKRKGGRKKKKEAGVPVSPDVPVYAPPQLPPDVTPLVPNE